MHFFQTFSSLLLFGITASALPPNTRATERDVDGVDVYSGGGFAGVELDGTAVTHIEAEIKVPHISVPAGGDPATQYGFAAWVGIENSAANVLWQAGIVVTIQNGKITYGNFYEWFPGPSYPFSSALEYTAGDRILMSVTATTGTSGTASLKNLESGQTVHVSVSKQPYLQRDIPLFLVEDYEVGSGHEPLAAFTPIQWTACGFTDSAGKGRTLAGGQITNIPGQTTTTVHNGRNFTVNYVG